MGIFSVDIEVAAIAKRRRKVRVRVIVDTGAEWAVIPGRILRTLGITPSRQVKLRTADGRHLRRWLGEAVVRVDGQEWPMPVMFGAPRDAPVFGALALEHMDLQVDPRRRRLVPIKEHLWA